MNEDLPAEEIAINSGLNKKTISNMYRSATKQIVIEASNEHFESLYNSIQALVENEQEVDLILRNDSNEYKCEVKLMGQGNPESADAIIARGSSLFVADTLSQQNKNQCDQLGICWVTHQKPSTFDLWRVLSWQ